MKMMQQFVLAQFKDTGITRMVTWLECDSRLQPGVHITLKDSHEVWIIESKGEESHPMSNLGKHWDVGGLDHRD